LTSTPAWIARFSLLFKAPVEEGLRLISLTMSRKICFCVMAG
jgi:hypothetical protein